MAECSLVALFFFFNVKQVKHPRALRPTHLLLKPWRPLRTNAANAAAPTHFYIFTFLQEGSWKDIGMSITHFIMGNLLALLTTGTIAPRSLPAPPCHATHATPRSGVCHQLLLRRVALQRHIGQNGLNARKPPLSPVRRLCVTWPPPATKRFCERNKIAP